MWIIESFKKIIKIYEDLLAALYYYNIYIEYYII